jgi:hypothetical protein
VVDYLKDTRKGVCRKRRNDRAVISALLVAPGTKSRSSRFLANFLLRLRLLAVKKLF